MKNKGWAMVMAALLTLPGLALAEGVDLSKPFPNRGLGFHSGMGQLAGQVDEGWVYFAQADYMLRYPVAETSRLQPYGGVALTLNWGEGELSRSFEDTAEPQTAKIWGADLAYKNTVYLDTHTPITPYVTGDVGAGFGELRHQEQGAAARQKNSAGWESDNAMIAHAGAGGGVEIALPQTYGWAMQAEAKINSLHYFVSTSDADEISANPVVFSLGVTKWMN